MKTLLHERREALIRKWIERTVASYPEKTRAFLLEQGDRFANPIGNTIKDAIGPIFDGLLSDAPREDLVPHLERIIRITCVQDLSPSGSVSFVFALKGVVEEEVAPLLPDPKVYDELLRFHAHIDELATWAFDVHAQFRERISEIRVAEAKRAVSTLIRMSKLTADPDAEPDPGTEPKRRLDVLNPGGRS